MVISYVSAGLYVLLGIGAILLGANCLLSLPVAIILSVLETVGLCFLECRLQKKRLANDSLKLWWSKDTLSTKACVAEFILIGISTLLINVALSIFNDNSYGIHHYGEYESEFGYFSCFEVIPDGVDTLLALVIPVLFYVFIISGRRFLSLLSGVFAFLGIIANNTICQFGEYYIVAAAGNESLRYNDVSEFANTVTTMLFILAIGFMLVSLVDIIFNRKKNKILIIASVITFLIGAAALGGAYLAKNDMKTFDIQTLKIDIYGDNKAASERFQQNNNFHNKYGSMSTKCAHPGCDNYIVKSGDSNCGGIHSNNCGNCGCYIDEDAMYCMSCLEEALK